MSNRFALRAQTQADHARLDGLAARFDLSRPADYREFLLWHAGIVPPLERHLERNGISTLLADWPQRARHAALMADLDALGAAQFPSGEALAERIDLGHTAAALWGIAYVLEGSRLGASVLVARVSPQFRANATQYLEHGHDERLWTRFSHALDGQIFTTDQLAEAGRAARSVFTLFAATIPPAAQSTQFHKAG